MAEWSCSGLQIRVRRFNSDPSLHYNAVTCPCGGIGRRKGLKIPRPLGIPVRVRARAPCRSVAVEVGRDRTDRTYRRRGKRTRRVKTALSACMGCKSMTMRTKASRGGRQHALRTALAAERHMVGQSMISSGTVVRLSASSEDARERDFSRFTNPTLI